MKKSAVWLVAFGALLAGAALGAWGMNGVTASALQHAGAAESAVASQELKAGNLENAVTHSLRAICSQPEHYRGYAAMAQVHEKLGDHRSALLFFRSAAEVNERAELAPDDEDARVWAADGKLIRDKITTLEAQSQ